MKKFLITLCVVFALCIAAIQGCTQDNPIKMSKYTSTTIVATANDGTYNTYWIPTDIYVKDSSGYIKALFVANGKSAAFHATVKEYSETYIQDSCRFRVYKGIDPDNKVNLTFGIRTCKGEVQEIDVYDGTLMYGFPIYSEANLPDKLKP